MIGLFFTWVSAFGLFLYAGHKLKKKRQKRNDDLISSGIFTDYEPMTNQERIYQWESKRVDNLLLIKGQFITDQTKVLTSASVTPTQQADMFGFNQVSP